MNTTETIEARARRLVQQEVLCCVSSLVSTLASGYGEIFGSGVNKRGLGDLAEQAYELARPIEDHEEPAREAGWREEPLYGIVKGEGDDMDFAVGWEDACLGEDLEPYEHEVYEHWAVTDWFGQKLEAQGERVDFDFGNLTVWARTTTGQAIDADYVVKRIAADLLKD